MQKVKCGDANPKGNIFMKYKGGCMKDLPIEEAYRCTGCDGWFHKKCILEHFKLEKEHDVGRNELREKVIATIVNNSPPSNDQMKIVRAIRKL